MRFDRGKKARLTHLCLKYYNNLQGGSCLLKKTILLFHPALQAAATLTSLYVLALGWQRVRFNHLNQKKARFNWKRHVLFGKIAMGLWFFGMIGGILLVSLFWSQAFMSGTHAKVGLTMGGLILLGFFTGFYMDKKKGRRRFLPLLHGLTNLILVVLSLWQAWTGLALVRFMVL